MAPRFNDHTGQRFGRLTVLGISDRVGNTYWRCLCDCGKESVTTGGNLRGGKATSCGCVQKEFAAALGRRHAKHGMHKSPEWTAWSGMRERCQNPRNKNFSCYGGRGISVCDAWQDFEQFYKDMGQRPPGMTLDRIDVNGNYEPENCRWATKSVQSKNQRRFQEPEAKAEWLEKLLAGQERGRKNHSEAQRRRWARWRAERAVS